ncbi:glycosyltransferase [Deefgea piscis]|uniref:glycosyltransferase n=1 Tax=Deefgea piscis TaxID=2739061 RepID=UPI001C81BEF6|nr:glycosyltransferase [Deefgea piscis]QZA81267.1 glycosyltransferase [Deefgea piscis]
MIKVSVIVPCYNAANKITACLRSLDEQTLPADQFEVIFVDDCSKDNTLALMHLEVAKRKNWYLFQTDANSGSASRPRNVGLDVAVGNYVFFLDCDDSLFSDTLESYLNFAEQNNADLVRGYLIADDGHTRKAMNRVESFNQITSRDERLVKIISSQSTTVPQLIRASILRQNSIQWPEHIRMGEDTIFLIDCLIACQEIAYIDHPTFTYNKSKNGEESVTQKYGARELQNHLTVWTEAEERLNRIGLSYLSIRLRIGLQSALLALIKFYTHDIDFELFIKFAEFINQHQKLISSFTYNERLKSILDTLYAQDYEQFNVMIQPRLVVAGYDLKFIQSALPDLSQYFQIEVDEWTGHNAHDEARSRKLLAWADIIFCEWLLGNAVWYAKHKMAEQKLFVRVHRFELTTPWCKKIDHSKVDSFFAVSLYFFEKAIERIGCPRSKMMLLPNFIDVNGYEQSDDPERVFRLAMIGILPSRKGFKQGLEILNELVKVDRRYTLEIAGKRPEDLPWIAKDPVEMAYFTDCQQFIEQNCLEQHVIFSGWQDIKKTAKNFGFVLSTSKSEEIPESFHIAPADAFCSGGIGLFLQWTGVEYIYPKEYIKRDSVELVDFILSTNSAVFPVDGSSGISLINNRYSQKIVISDLVNVINLSSVNSK